MDAMKPEVMPFRMFEDDDEDDLFEDEFGEDGDLLGDDDDLFEDDDEDALFDDDEDEEEGDHWPEGWDDEAQAANPFRMLA